MASYGSARRLLLDQAAESDETMVGDDFDTNMVIILAALLCSLICALGLNSIVRCALRCRHGPSAQAAPVAGMKKRDLRRIPVAAYERGAETFQGTECAICLADFAEGEKVRVLPECRHAFHVACIDRWLLSNSSCPNCRHSVLENKAACQEAVGGGRRPGNEAGGGVAVAGRES